MGEDKERRRCGDCTFDMQRKIKKLREETGERRQIHRIFQERRRQESRTRMTGRREGIKQGSVYICVVMYSRVNTLRMNESPL